MDVRGFTAGAGLALALVACGGGDGLQDFPCDYEGRCPGAMHCDVARAVCVGGACGAPLTECDGDCVVLTADPSHCGACGHACQGSEACVNGTCRPGTTAGCSFCAPGLECVDGACGCAGRGDLCFGALCMDLQQSRVSCGVCLQGCGVSGTACRAGQCVCPPGQKVCGTSCVDVATDAANCGDCGQACSGATPKCERGACVAACSGAACGDGRCWDTATDARHCGAGCTRCADDQVCEAGTCSCPAGAESCSGECTVTATDPLNCGSCGTACAAGESCVAGQCTCQGKLTRCGATCAVLSDDPANCGACGTACGAGEVCANGTCAAACPLGWATCDGACADTMNDPANCGGCGTTCNPGEACVDGSCEREHPALGCTSCPCDYCSFTLDALCCVRQGAPFCITSSRCPP